MSHINHMLVPREITEYDIEKYSDFIIHKFVFDCSNGSLLKHGKDLLHDLWSITMAIRNHTPYTLNIPTERLNSYIIEGIPNTPEAQKDYFELYNVKSHYEVHLEFPYQYGMDKLISKSNFFIERFLCPVCKIIIPDRPFIVHTKEKNVVRYMDEEGAKKRIVDIVNDMYKYLYYNSLQSIKTLYFHVHKDYQIQIISSEKTEEEDNQEIERFYRNRDRNR